MNCTILFIFKNISKLFFAKVDFGLHNVNVRTKGFVEYSTVPYFDDGIEGRL